MTPDSSQPATSPSATRGPAARIPDQAEELRPPVVFRTEEIDHNLHVRDGQRVPWCQQCSELAEHGFTFEPGR